MDTKTSQAILHCLTWRGLPVAEDQGRIASNILLNDVFALMNDQKWTVGDLLQYREDLMISLGDIIALRAGEFISARHAKTILLAVWELPYLNVVDYLIESKILHEVDDSVLEALLVSLIEQNPKIVAQIRNGKAAAAGSFVGMAMKQQKCDPLKVKAIVNRLLEIEG